MSFNETISFLQNQQDLYLLSMGKRKLIIPKRSDGITFKIAFLRRDQQEVAAVVFHNIYLWLYGKQYKPLRLTVCGVGGSGKSTLIQTIVASVRTLFQRNDVVHVCAPTGSAAFSAGGETIHRLFSIRVHGITDTLQPTTRKRLQARFANVVVLIVDERSMLSSEILGVMESFSRQSVHNGLNTNKPWGYIPVIILVGDDYQLPPIFKGAFESLAPMQDRVRQLKSKAAIATQIRIARGHHQFREIGSTVMYLKASRRVLSGQNRLARILAGLRGENGDSLSEEDIEFLATNFHLMSPHFTDEDRKRLCKDALFLFALKKPKNILNEQRLHETHFQRHPVARIKARTMSHGKRVSNNSHYDSDAAPPLVFLCIDAQVCLTGHNVCPEWGLFNGSVGTVKDVVFHKDETPNRGDLPAYVLVEFSVYKGPVFDPKNPKLVPIVPITRPCKNHNCGCDRTFLPVKLCFAKTCHTFQGQNAGPVAKNQPPNAVQRIICHPGSRAFEGQNVGLFYTILSRATTLGDCDESTPPHQRFKNSAIYFIGQNMNKSRIRNITLQNNGRPFANVIKRDRWVRFLRHNELHLSFSDEEIANLFQWLDNTRID